MLNRSKLLKEFEKVSDAIFYDNSKEIMIAKQIWQEISNDPNFLQNIKNLNIPWALPSWKQNLSDTFLSPTRENYKVLPIDGSQIYPDRHAGNSCFLLNIGSVLLTYNKISHVKLDSIPFIFSEQNENAVELVDCKRQELEFQFGLDMSLSNKIKDLPLLFLFDGSLIFWHLESKSPSIGQEFLGKYLGQLHQFYKNDLLIASLISLPKSKELVNLIRAKLMLTAQDVSLADNITDIQIVNFYLKPFCRTIIFQNNSNISNFYPEHLKTHFFYLNVMQEIVRIEIPSWIAQDEIKINLITSIIIDQCVKGYGYPVCISEAHEQAVIKGPDRDFFYHYLYKLASNKDQNLLASQKSIKKKFMGY